MRVTERFLASDPPRRPSSPLRRVRARAAPELEPRGAIGVAGTVTTLATLDLGLASTTPTRTHGTGSRAPRSTEQLDRLAGMTLAERLGSRNRAGARARHRRRDRVLREILDTYGLAEIEASERDVLHGAAFAAAELPEPKEGAAPPGAYTCC